MTSMLRWFASIFFVLFGCAVALPGQATEADIKARLKDRPLYLRGFWRDDNLHFNGQGILLGKSDPTSFTLSGFDFDSVRLKKDKLILDGWRVGIEFHQDIPKRVRLEEMDIEIALPVDGNFTVVLDMIVADGLEEISPSLPNYWQDVAGCLLDSKVQTNPDALPSCTNDRAKKRDSDLGAMESSPSVSPPIVRKRVDAAFNRYALERKYQGTVTLNCIVSPQGLPTGLTVVGPAGLGLDEMALFALTQYRFEPAKRDGQPVSSKVDVVIAFHFF